MDASPLVNVRKPVDHRAWFLCRELHHPVTADCKHSRKFLEGVRTLRGLTTLTTRLILERLWRSREVPKARKRNMLCPSSTKATRTTRGAAGHSTSLECLMERFILDHLSGHMKEKKVTRKSPHRLPEGKSFLTNLIAFCENKTCTVEGQRVVEVTYHDFKQGI